MATLRTFLLTRRWLAFGLVALALAMRALVPAGFMPGGSAASGHLLAISICADASGNAGQGRQILIPVSGKTDPSPSGSDSHDNRSQSACAFSALSFAALGGADAVLLVAALAFVLAIGFAHAPPLRLARIAGLRPPLRGPPARV
ncbi:DUF2946 family protein [Novosphingobium sp.]|uniref:DUF2946 family protein n=1 Tax=Novosphingobium sp. TaxID=1874826 RepID=UPI0025E871EB|nr:DUF2946 family protein [Novosphingobium sp.]